MTAPVVAILGVLDLEDNIIGATRSTPQERDISGGEMEATVSLSLQDMQCCDGDGSTKDMNHHRADP